MNTETNRVVEAVGASAATVGTFGACLADANAFLQFAVTLATFAWWVRLWIKNPKLPPPGTPK